MNSSQSPRSGGGPCAGIGPIVASAVRGGDAAYSAPGDGSWLSSDSGWASAATGCYESSDLA